MGSVCDRSKAMSDRSHHRKPDQDMACILRAMEIPDCSCRTPNECMSGEIDYPIQCPGIDKCTECPQPPCIHVQQSIHDVSIPVWAFMLEMLDPEAYIEPAEMPLPSMVVAREARRFLLQQRAEYGLCLYHPDDLADKRHRETVSEDKLELAKDGSVRETAQEEEIVILDRSWDIFAKLASKARKNLNKSVNTKGKSNEKSATHCHRKGGSCPNGKRRSCRSGIVPKSRNCP